MEERRCFTYCGDDACTCEARDVGIIPAGGWKPMTNPTQATGSLGVSQDEQTASLLSRERDEWKAEYLRRHRDCGDLVEQFGVQHGDLQAAQARIKVLEGALTEIAEGITPPHQNGHYLQARNAVLIARAALPQVGGENG